MRYGIRLGCRGGQPHDLIILNENKTVKVEVCQICNKKFRWQKGLRGRIDNQEYLKAHIRNFAQRGGATKRVYMKIYKPDKCKIVI